MDVAGWLLLHSRWSVRKSAKPSARLHLRLASRRCVRCVGKGDAAGSRRAEGNMPMVRSFGAAAILICSLVPCQAQFAPPPLPPYPTAPQAPTAVPFPDRPQPPPAVMPPGAPPPSPLNPGQSNAAPQLQGGLQLNCTAVGQRVYQRSGEPSFLDSRTAPFSARVAAVAPGARFVERDGASYMLQCRPDPQGGGGEYCVSEDLAETWVFRQSEFQYQNTRPAAQPGMPVGLILVSGTCS